MSSTNSLTQVQPQAQAPAYTVQVKESYLAWGYVDCAAYHLPGGEIDPSAYLFIRKDGKVEVHTKFIHFCATPQQFGETWVILTGWVDTIVGYDWEDKPIIGKRQARLAVPRKAWSVAQLYAAQKMGVRKGQLPPAPPPPPVLIRMHTMGRASLPVGAY